MKLATPFVFVLIIPLKVKVLPGMIRESRLVKFTQPTPAGVRAYVERALLPGGPHASHGDGIPPLAILGHATTIFLGHSEVGFHLAL